MIGKVCKFIDSEGQEHNALIGGVNQDRVSLMYVNPKKADLFMTGHFDEAIVRVLDVQHISDKGGDGAVQCFHHLDEEPTIHNVAEVLEKLEPAEDHEQ